MQVQGQGADGVWSWSDRFTSSWREFTSAAISRLDIAGSHCLLRGASAVVAADLGVLR
jgi:hypothetical protein